jgi:hypothetical protein
MLSRLVSLLILAVLTCGPSAAAAATDEAALLEAIATYERIWNQRDVAAWKEAVTADLLYEETFTSALLESRRINTRERAQPVFELSARDFSLKWQPLRIVMKPDGSATAVMRIVQTANNASFETNPAIARWRIEDGRWKLYHYVTHAPHAREIVASERLQ